MVEIQVSDNNEYDLIGELERHEERAREGVLSVEVQIRRLEHELEEERERLALFTARANGLSFAVHAVMGALNV